MSKERAEIQYHKLVNYFDKLQILAIHIKYLIDNTKSEDDLNYLAERIEEFDLMLSDRLVLNKVSKEISVLYEELNVDMANISSDVDINNRIKNQLK